MGKHSDAELRALAALETSLDVSNRTSDDVQLVGREGARQVLGDWIDLEKRVDGRVAGLKPQRPSRLARYAWLLWVVPTVLACATGITTVIYLVAAS